MVDKLEALVRPIIGIENRSAQEAFDIMADRVRSHFTTPANGEQVERVQAELAAMTEWKDRLASAFQRAEARVTELLEWKLAAISSTATPTTDARERIKVLEDENRHLRLIAQAVRTRMATACDWTKAGKDHVKVRTADWHVLMEIGDRARTALGNKEPGHGG